MVTPEIVIGISHDRRWHSTLDIPKVVLGICQSRRCHWDRSFQTPAPEALEIIRFVSIDLPSSPPCTPLPAGQSLSTTFGVPSPPIHSTVLNACDHLPLAAGCRTCTGQIAASHRICADIHPQESTEGYRHLTDSRVWQRYITTHMTIVWNRRLSRSSDVLSAIKQDCRATVVKSYERTDAMVVYMQHSVKAP